MRFHNKAQKLNFVGFNNTIVISWKNQEKKEKKRQLINGDYRKQRVDVLYSFGLATFGYSFAIDKLIGE